MRMLMATSPLLLGGCSLWRSCNVCTSLLSPATPAPEERDDLGETQTQETGTPQELSDRLLKDERARSDYFDHDFPEDILYSGEKFEMLKRLTMKFRNVQKHIGFGNFNLIGMDEFFRVANSSLDVGGISAEEKLFLEELFYFDAKRYGFNGDKIFPNFTDSVGKSDALKIPRTGHYLKKGESLEIYDRLKKDIGDSLILTSGFRAVAKQFHLFLEKGLESGGNISKASRSLAPPGYSFHGRGDFDVGKVGYGLKNFTQDFASTDEYKRLLDLGYIRIRYTQSNLLGVRFEPWHIKVEG